MAESQSGLVSVRLHDLVVEIGVDESIAVLTNAKHVTCCDPVVVEMFALRTDYHMALVFMYDKTFLNGR